MNSQPTRLRLADVLHHDANHGRLWLSRIWLDTCERLQLTNAHTEPRAIPTPKSEWHECQDEGDRRRADGADRG